MYQIGELVVYGIHGVCRVTSQEQQTSAGKQVVYLVLEPLDQEGSKFLIPAHNAAAMAKVKPILTREEWLELFTSDTVRTDVWIPDENQRKQCYREVITGGNRSKLLQQIRTLYRHKKVQTSIGRKVHICDENFLRDAEKILISELSVVFGLEPEVAKDMLRSKVKEDA